MGASRPTAPPPMAELDRARERCGDARLAIAFGDVSLALEGLDPEAHALLDERFATYAAADGAEPRLRVEVVRARRDYFITPPERPELNPVLLACDGERVRYLGYRVAGWFDAAGGSGRLLLAGGDYERVERALENYIRAAVAWQAASLGGAFVHAASAVLDGRGYLFYGESGAGKSTLSASNRRARVVSDDLSLLLPGVDGRLDLVGSPFRGTYEGGEPVVGRFPLAAGFRLVQAPTAEVRPVARIRALAELTANLPFVADSLGTRPDVFERLRVAIAPVPLAHLHFRKDDSYWDAIARAGL